MQEAQGQSLVRELDPTPWPRPPYLAGFELGKPAQEDDEAYHCGGHQHVSVPAEPGEVQGHFLSKVVPTGTASRQGHSDRKSVG